MTALNFLWEFLKVLLGGPWRHDLSYFVAFGPPSQRVVYQGVPWDEALQRYWELQHAQVEEDL